MDLNVISRLESHGKDLFRLGQKLAPIREGQQSDESGESEGGEEPQGEDKRHIPPECAGTQGESLVEAEQRLAKKERKQQGLQAQQRYRMKRKVPREKAHYEDLWAAFTRNMGKGFVLGSCSKLVLNLLYPILNLARGRRHGLTSKVLFEDVQGYGLFMGSLLALYNATMYETKKYAAEFAFVKHYRGMGAGFLAGIALLWMPRKKRWPIVLFTLVRALELQTKLLVKRKLIPSIEHGDVLLMSLASGSMLHNFVFDRAVLDPSYAGFLSKQSQAPPVIQDTFARMCLGQPLDLERINRWRATLQGVGPLKDPMIYDKVLSRKILHPHLSFPGYVSRYFITAMKQALPVYLPVFSLPIILFYPGLLINKPVETVTRVLRGVLRSCLFLSMYVTVGFNSMEAMRDMGLRYSNVGSLAQLLIPFAGFISGFATLIEKKGRRIELALYVLSKAIEGRCNQALKYFTPMRNSDVLAFMYSFGVLAHAYTSHPSMFRPAYAGVMARFFDTDRRHKFYSMPRIMSKSLLSSTGDEKANLSQRVLSTIQRVQENHKQLFEDSDDPQENHKQMFEDSKEPQENHKQMFEDSEDPHDSHKPVIKEHFEPQDTEEAHM